VLHGSSIHPCWRARTNDLAEKTFLLEQNFKRIVRRLCWPCMKGFPERWIIILPRCLPARKFPTFASGRQDREQQLFQISVLCFPEPGRVMLLGKNHGIRRSIWGGEVIGLACDNRASA